MNVNHCATLIIFGVIGVQIAHAYTSRNHFSSNLFYEVQDNYTLPRSTFTLFVVNSDRTYMRTLPIFAGLLGVRSVPDH